MIKHIELDSRSNYNIFKRTTTGKSTGKLYYSARVVGNEQTNKAEVFGNGSH